MGRLAPFTLKDIETLEPESKRLRVTTPQTPCDDATAGGSGLARI